VAGGTLTSKSRSWRSALPSKRIAALKDAVLHMEDLKDATEIPKLLSAA
jgi:hypothetical protein